VLVGGTPSIGSRTHDDFNDMTSTLHSEQTLCSNPAVSNVHTVIYYFYQLSGGTTLPVPQPPHDRFSYDLASSTDVYARGLQKMLMPSPLTSEFMGMASYAPASFHDLMDDEV